MTNTGSKWRTIAAFVIVGLVWGSTWIVVKGQLALVPPPWALTYRFILATTGMIVLTLARRESLRVSRTALWMALALGIGQFCANFLFGYAGARYLTSGIVTVFFALNIIPNSLAGRIWLGDRLSPRLIAGSAVAVVGIVMLLLREYRFAPSSDSVVVGILCLLGAVVLAAATNLLQSLPSARREPLVPMITWAMGFGMIADLGFAALTSGPPPWPADPAFWLSIVYLALIGSVLTFPLYFYLVREIGAGKASYTSVMVPVVGMVLSTIFEGYQWTLLTAGGAGLAVIGLVIALSGSKQGA